VQTVRVQIDHATGAASSCSGLNEKMAGAYLLAPDPQRTQALYVSKQLAGRILVLGTLNFTSADWHLRSCKIGVLRPAAVD
jgi:hypothetical protein